MADLFCAHKAAGTKIPSYFIESTAPDNVDDRPAQPPSLPSKLVPIAADEAVKEIAQHLAAADDPNLVVMVHGFNNPPPVVLQLYELASDAIEADAAIRDRPGLVCVGYRWPSESMGQPRHGTFSALPSLPAWILWAGVIALVSYPILGLLRHIPGLARLTAWLEHVPILVGWALVGLVLMLALLRVIVYFRDIYRASNYGAPDLIEIVRQIDRAITDIDRQQHGDVEAKTWRQNRRVQLSFVGHSMGGFVVTNAIRSLTDLFDRDAMRAGLNVGLDEHKDMRLASLPREIGHVFRLTRFVLVSPDIPAEALLSNRGNFLASSLRRFREAYLFSNEGDEVLRLISTTANYFSFPTMSWKFGFRLGNVEILSEQYGIVPPAPGGFLATLRVGYYTLPQLYDRLREAREAAPPGSRAPRAGEARAVQSELPEVFTYFDCTDYVEPPTPGAPPAGVLTFALRTKRSNPHQRMGWWNHLQLLWSYLVHQTPDVHGGYFRGALSRELLFRLACLGFDGTIAAYGGTTEQLSAKCEEKQIRVLVSPQLERVRGATSVGTHAA